MASHRRPIPVSLAAQSWGDLAVARMPPNWLGRVWESDAHSVLLVDQEGQIVRLVTETIGDGPFHIVVPGEAVERWEQLPRNLYCWRVGSELWFGDAFTLHLPSTRPWESTLTWDRDELDVDETVVARRLALLGDWLLARAPEGSIPGVLPELLASIASGSPLGKAADRPDLPLNARLFRWRSARVLGGFLPALASGDLAAAETSVNSLAGLGAGSPPAGDQFLLGLIAGVYLWPEFLSEGSGLNAPSLVQRLARSVAERTSLLGDATLRAALDGRWEARWHALRDALVAMDSRPHDLQERVETVAAEWLAQDEVTGSAALAGVVVPFLWYQRFLT